VAHDLKGASGAIGARWMGGGRLRRGWDAAKRLTVLSGDCGRLGALQLNTQLSSLAVQIGAL
jgi:hypothetical protein